jgi:hypothetical protein
LVADSANFREIDPELAPAAVLTIASGSAGKSFAAWSAAGG